MELEKTNVLLNTIIMAEVNDWLSKCIDKVIQDTCCSGVKRRRMTYSPKQKVRAVDTLRNLKHELPGVSKRALESKVDQEEKAMAIAKVCDSHDIIRLAAEKVRNMTAWKDDGKVQKLKCPECHHSSPDTSPSRERAEAHERDLEGNHKDGGFTRADVFSGDKTVMLFGAPAIVQYIPFDADRAAAPEGDDKARFSSFLYGSAEGNMEPSFNIVKCASKNPFDLSGTRVLHKLHATPSFSAQQEELSAQQGQLCKRPYLIHTDGTVITCQNKAWMDSAGMTIRSVDKYGDCCRKEINEAADPFASFGEIAAEVDIVTRSAENLKLEQGEEDFDEEDADD
ncbi:MAG: hypothetical protein SGPRY_014788 [Prymnesium sp.]